MLTYLFDAQIDMTLYHGFNLIAFEHTNPEIELVKENPQNPTWSDL